MKQKDDELVTLPSIKFRWGYLSIICGILAIVLGIVGNLIWMIVALIPAFIGWSKDKTRWSLAFCIAPILLWLISVVFMIVALKIGL
jgi:hypothetical protein